MNIEHEQSNAVDNIDYFTLFYLSRN